MLFIGGVASILYFLLIGLSLSVRDKKGEKIDEIWKRFLTIFIFGEMKLFFIREVIKVFDVFNLGGELV